MPEIMFVTNIWHKPQIDVQKDIVYGNFNQIELNWIELSTHVCQPTVYGERAKKRKKVTERMK